MITVSKHTRIVNWLKIHSTSVLIDVYNRIDFISLFNLNSLKIILNLYILMNYQLKSSTQF